MIQSVKRRKLFITVFLLAMAFCNVVLLLREVSSLRNGYQDFTIYYMSALLLRSGQGADLYNSDTQYRAQLTFAHVPIRQGPLPFNHPPFEAIVFLPFTLLSYWPAYLLWTAINVIMLALSVVLLRRRFPRILTSSPLVLGLGAAAFFPVAIAIVQGQDVVLLLLLFVLAVICLDRGQDATAGALLAGGLFRPHLIVPILVLLAVRRWRLLRGFVPAALVLVAMSVAITGWNGPHDYIQFVLHVEKTVCHGCFGPQTVPNLRGLFQDLPGLGASSRAATALVLVSSLVIFFVALRRIWNGRDSIGFSSNLAVVTTLLVSFHLLTHDLILLLPLALILLTQSLDRQTVDRQSGDSQTKLFNGKLVLVSLLFLTPLYVFLLWQVDQFFWFSLVLIWLYMILVLTPAPAEVPA
jgi:hypothetical protein